MSNMSQDVTVRAPRDRRSATIRSSEPAMFLSAADRLRLVQRLTHVGMWTYDPGRRTFAWSDEAGAILPGAVSGGVSDLASLAEHVHPDDREAVTAAFAALGNDPQEVCLLFRLSVGGLGFQLVHMQGLPAGVNGAALPGPWVGTIGPPAAQGSSTAGSPPPERRRHWLPVRRRARRAVVTAGDEEELATMLCEVLVQTAGYLAAVVLTEDPDGRARILGRSATCSNCRFPGVAFADGERPLPLRHLVDAGRPTVMTLSGGAGRDAVAGQTSPCSKAAAVAALPFGAFGSGSPGMMLIWGSTDHCFAGPRLEDLSDLADDLSFGLLVMRDRQKQIRSAMRLEHSMEQTVAALAATIEKRDPYTAGHQRRVSVIACQIARVLGMSQDLVHGIELAANIHDIGKIYVPSEILARPGRLSAAEFHVIQDHCQVGYEIVKDIDLQWDVAEMLLQHHERLDGSGYPHALKDDAILFGAHIIGVADTVEAMASHRPYRPGLGIARAVAEIREGAGSRYDGRAAGACLSLFDAGELVLDAPP